MKNYSVSEFAQAVGVTNVTINNWIRDGEVTPYTTLTGQKYFTSSQVIDVLLRVRLKSKNMTSSSTLYIVNSQNNVEKDANCMSVCHEVQRKHYPASILISDFENMFSDKLDSYSLELSNEKVQEAVRVALMGEFVDKFESYIKDKVVSIFSIDKSIQDAFTWTELKALVTNDTSVVNQELIHKYDSIVEAIQNDPSDKYVNADGSIKKNLILPYKVLSKQIYDKVIGIIRELGFTNPELYRIVQSNPDVMRNRDLVICMQDASFPLKADAPAVVKALKKLSLNTEKNFVRNKLASIFKNGFYHLFLYKDMEEINDNLYHFLDMRVFRNVCLVGCKLEDLPADIRRKIKVGIDNNYFRFEQI